MLCTIMSLHEMKKKIIVFLLTHFSVIGAVDGKHVRIRKFPNSGSLNWNYKKFNSIILLAFVDHNYRWVRGT